VGNDGHVSDVSPTVHQRPDLISVSVDIHDALIIRFKGERLSSITSGDGIWEMEGYQSRKIYPLLPPVMFDITLETSKGKY
jgi:hypothetical protein